LISKLVVPKGFWLVHLGPTIAIYQRLNFGIFISVAIAPKRNISSSLQIRS
jgi:hypothetical protein